MRKLLSFTLVVLSIVTITIPYGYVFQMEKKYLYNAEEVSTSLTFTPVYEPVASIGTNGLLPTRSITSGSMNFASGKDMFSFRIPRTFDITKESDLTISVNQNGSKIPLEIDDDGDERMLQDAYYFTKPVFIDPTAKLTYSIEKRADIAINQISVIGLDTSASSDHVVLAPEVASAASDSGSLHIVSRAEWGADETLRYKDNPSWQVVYANIAKNAGKPQSDAQIAATERIKNIRTYLATNFSEQDTPVETITQESGHELVWPIEKTRQVQRVTIHHTADDNRTEKDDLSMIRGIYYYHTMVRGWGDIGYNYVVGQRGQIYEGRAGGDYTVAAHALWNNKSTVGISVMGNFQNDSVIQDQEDGVRRAVNYLVAKYGVDLSKTSIGHKECKTSDTCLLKDFSVPNLIGHRDVGFTSCPGDNLYPLIATIRTTDTASRGLVYHDNPNIPSIRVASSINTPFPGSTATPLAKWPNIRIRLSYTGSSISLKSYTNELPRVSLGKAGGMLKKNLELSFEASGTDKVALVLGNKRYPFIDVSYSGSLIQITNWNRKPAWDTSGTYNDNIFRGKISVANDNGKLVVINELPLEDYLHGIAEVSNGDNTEKMKTILVAARSYAYFYTNPNNRKFPGKNYDGSDNPDEFQKYLGYGYEKRSPNTAALVDATNGQLITYNGTPIKPWYFNESDGRTRSAKEYCENRVKTGSLPKNSVCEDIPYLQSVSDPGGVGHTQKGHGVGISGIGATYLATNMNFNYEQIIEYYLEGVKVEKKY